MRAAWRVHLLSIIVPTLEDLVYDNRSCGGRCPAVTAARTCSPALPCPRAGETANPTPQLAAVIPRPAGAYPDSCIIGPGASQLGRVDWHWTGIGLWGRRRRWVYFWAVRPPGMAAWRWWWWGCADGACAACAPEVCGLEIRAMLVIRAGGIQLQPGPLEPASRGVGLGASPAARLRPLAIGPW